MYKNRNTVGVFCSLPALFTLLFLTFFLFLPTMASALQVTLEWDENKDSNLAGYRVFLCQQGENYDYSNPAWEGAETTCRLFSLDENVRYYFVVRAYTTSGQESGNSNEVTYISRGVVIVQNSTEEIIGTWSSGIWFWGKASSRWTQMDSDVPSGAIAAGDFTGDGRADVASVWGTGLWYQNGVTLGWTRVYHTAPDRIAAGDITGDGRDEIIGCGDEWDSGFWYRDVSKGKWYHPYDVTPDGAIAAGDITGDGKADIISIWSDGLWYQNGATLRWTRISYRAPDQIAAGDITGDRQDEVICCGGDLDSGVWYRDVSRGTWHHPSDDTPDGEIAAGDVTGDGKADIISIWSDGLWYQDGANLGWTRVHNVAPNRIAAGDITGN